MKPRGFTDCKRHDGGNSRDSVVSRHNYYRSSVYITPKLSPDALGFGGCMLRTKVYFRKDYKLDWMFMDLKGVELAPLNLWLLDPKKIFVSCRVISKL
jgi:hypothetical protein